MGRQHLWDIGTFSNALHQNQLLLLGLETMSNPGSRRFAF